jgi:sortase A
MRDKRPVDELSIEELERILAIRKREERQKNMTRMQQNGRVLAAQSPIVAPAPLATQPPAANGNGVATAQPAKPTPSPLDHLPLINSTPMFEDSGPLPAVVADKPKRKAPAPAVDDVPPADNRAWKRFVNGFTLFVEVAAVLALVYLGYELLQSINKAQSETAAAVAAANEQRMAGLPTIEPTPQLRLDQVVLPGGHIFTASGNAQFNVSEIPTHLQARVFSEIMQPLIQRPMQTSETALRLTIPSIGVDQTIVQGTDWDALSQGIGQLLNDTNPGDDLGNVVLAAHNDIFGELFRDLDQLQAGDQFQVQTQTQVYTYVVRRWAIHEPSDVHVMDPRGAATATLISCYPYRVSDKRIVVFADRINS